MLPDEPESLHLSPDPLLPPARCVVRWKRSARARRVSLRIDNRAGEVVVTLPPRAGRRAGLALLMTHAAWVTQRLAALAPGTRFAPGAEVPVGGVPHVIRHLPEARGGAWIEDGAILVAGDPAFLPRRVADCLKAEARRRIGALVAQHTARLGVRARAVRIKDPSSRWGSCAPDRTLAFSWRLVMAPAFVLDYVVAHEVAHLAEMNHSERFWAEVARLTPHREAAQRWLREHGPSLMRIG
ncbi:MAG: M48 family metallopeptidase [Acetobacteraceae bacterium]|nr:M48 family metallopeptidase [Acetobacteraceae bacterium]MCX7685141.1 M48 family metallopeptidase [Acetobacteraceae bacterium]MDW8398863.1 SprT family zinc-dependent metalloprotease [Acetobacteraceae bacterium]